MDVTAEVVRSIEPVVKKTTEGWLAISETLAPLRIAVVGRSEDEARERFAESREAWATLRGLPDPFDDA